MFSAALRVIAVDAGVSITGGEALELRLPLGPVVRFVRGQAFEF